ncbi:hypothetical protein ACFQ0I_09615 [Mariniflexile aquimaris]|uniref:DUF4263 domain-containing protein n=1 Tax=Mariniflexile aquimaris TaxID=881009 RepID=A0ABW3BSX7_9FLAO
MATILNFKELLMGRYFSNNKLLDKLTKGEFLPILNYIIRDDSLRIEMRINNQAKIYYKKSLVMTLFPMRQPELLSSGYWRESIQPVLDLESPDLYFKSAKKFVENHKRDIKENIEFEIQQKIAKNNSSINNRFLIIDMEYQFEQRKVTNRTNDKTRFDLVALDLKLNKIMLLELKQGLGTLTGNSGIDDHYLRFRQHISHPQFQTALKSDIKGILQSKQLLGLFEFDVNALIVGLDKAEIDYAYVFAAHSDVEMESYKKDFGSKYKTLYLDSQANNYTLNDGL